MKMKSYNIFWTILFAWIMISGPTYASMKCGDSGYNFCNETSPIASKNGSLISKCAKDSQCLSTLSITAGKKDFCCQKKKCTSETNLFLNTQNYTLQTLLFCFVDIGKNQWSKDVSLRPVFDQYRSIQPISIYTFTQSFLC